MVGIPEVLPHNGGTLNSWCIGLYLRYDWSWAEFGPSVQHAQRRANQLMKDSPCNKPSVCVNIDLLCWCWHFICCRIQHGHFKILQKVKIEKHVKMHLSYYQSLLLIGQFAVPGFLKNYNLAYFAYFCLLWNFAYFEQQSNFVIACWPWTFLTWATK